LGELTKQSHIMQCLFHGRITLAKPLLHKMGAKHCGNGKDGRPVLLAGAKGWIKPVTPSKAQQDSSRRETHACLFSW
jgi:hypothetical protein